MGPGKFIKIGWADAPQERLQELQIGSPYELCLLAARKCRSRQHAQHSERRLHSRLKREHVRGEWFKPTPYLHGVLAEFSEESEG